MGVNSHLTKKHFKLCDHSTPAYQRVKSSNIAIIQAVVGEFDRVRSERSISQDAALKELRISGVIVTKNGLWNYRKGTFYTASTTFLNIISHWSGYKDFYDLLRTVDLREQGESV